MVYTLSITGFALSANHAEQQVTAGVNSQEVSIGTCLLEGLGKRSSAMRRRVVLLQGLHAR